MSWHNTRYIILFELNSISVRWHYQLCIFYSLMSLYQQLNRAKSASFLIKVCKGTPDNFISGLSWYLLLSVRCSFILNAILVLQRRAEFWYCCNEFFAANLVCLAMQNVQNIWDKLKFKVFHFTNKIRDNISQDLGYLKSNQTDLAAAHVLRSKSGCYMDLPKKLIFVAIFCQDAF